MFLKPDKLLRESHQDQSVPLSPALPELIIFDCDGVLVDSELLACEAVANCLAEIGIIETTSDIAERYAGISAASMYADLEARSGRQISPDFRETVQRRILIAFEHNLCPMVGIEDALRVIRCKTCVASSSSIERIRFSLCKTGLIEIFGGNIFSATQVAAGKPAPDLFEFAARTMGADAARSVVVEDSVAGILAAKAAGMYGLGFFGGSHCTEDLAKKLCQAGARMTFEQMRQLPRIIDELERNWLSPNASRS